MRASDRRVMRRLSRLRGRVWTLSNDATHATGSPSSGPSSSSLLRPRIVLVQAATTTAPMRSATGSRVSTRTGRSPPGVAAHQTSPLTTMACPPRSLDRWPVPAPHWSVAAVRRDPRLVHRPIGTGTARPTAGWPQSGMHGRWAPGHRAAGPGRQASAPRSELSCIEYTDSSPKATYGRRSELLQRRALHVTSGRGRDDDVVARPASPAPRPGRD
jgi:hypothetical protein